MEQEQVGRSPLRGSGHSAEPEPVPVSAASAASTPNAVITPAMWSAIEWLRDHGNDCAVARVRGGGRIYLALGEHATFMPWTAAALVDAGLAEYVDERGRKSARFRLTAKATGAS